jgi:hypothetical protein
VVFDPPESPQPASTITIRETAHLRIPAR